VSKDQTLLFDQVFSLLTFSLNSYSFDFQVPELRRLLNSLSARVAVSDPVPVPADATAHGHQPQGGRPAPAAPRRRARGGTSSASCPRQDVPPTETVTTTEEPRPIVWDLPEPRPLGFRVDVLPGEEALAALREFMKANRPSLHSAEREVSIIDRSRLECYCHYSSTALTEMSARSLARSPKNNAIAGEPRVANVRRSYGC